MASSCPSGTVSVGTPQAPATPADITTLQTAFEAFIGTLSGFAVSTSGADYTVVKPASGAGRWLYTFSASKTIDAAQRMWRNSGAADQVHVGVSFDSTDADITNPWNGAANPFGAADFSGFGAACAVVSSNPIVSIFGGELVASGGSGEILEVFFQKTTSAHYNARAGAIFAQVDDSDSGVEATTKRVWGICTTQADIISATFGSASTSWPGSYSGVSNKPMMWARVSGSWSYAFRGNLDEPPLKVTSTVRYPTYPFYYYANGSSQTIGWLRNTRYMTPSIKKLMDVVNDTDGNPIGYACGYSTVASTDTIVFVSGQP